MAASVTIDHSAFSDRRVNYLGELAGYSHMEALGRLATLWSRCTELQTDRPGPLEIKACLGPHGERALIDSGLGEEQQDGEIRVRGCGGRHEWFAGYAQGAPRQTRGGKVRAAGARRDQQGHFLPSKSPGVAGVSLTRVAGPSLDVAGSLLGVAGPATSSNSSNYPAPIPISLPPDLSPGRPEPPDPGTAARVDRDHVAPPPLAPRQVGRLAESVWDRLSQARVAEAQRLRLAGVIPFPKLSPAHHPESFRELTARIREEGEDAASVCDHVIANLVAQSRETGDVEWLAEKSFLEGPWRTARNWRPGTRAGPKFSPRGTPEPDRAKTPFVR